MVAKNMARAIAVVVATVIRTATAEADESAATDSAAAGAAMEEIVVTAQKRVERSSDVPMSLAAISGEQLIKQGISSPADLSRTVAGFTYQESGLGAPVFSIRGVGFYDFSLGVSPTVSVYLDQVPLPYSVMTKGATLDLERVEVLKGPQGTLFGQNSTGGAINYIPAKPTRALAAGADLSYGRFNAVDAQGYLSGPLTEQLTGRVAVRTEQRGDWQYSYTRQDDRGRKDFVAARVLLDWHPADHLAMELNLNGWRDNSDTQANQFVAYSPSNPPPRGYPEEMAVLPGYPVAPRNARAADWDAPDGTPNTNFKNDIEFYQVALRTDWGINAGVTLTSISAYSDYQQRIRTDTDAANFNDLTVNQVGRLKVASQELRLVSSTADRLQWMAGANYQHDTTAENQLGRGLASNSGIGPFRYRNFVNLNEQSVNTYAGFGSLEYNISDALTAQVSSRYTKQDRSFDGCLRDAGDGQLATAIGFLSTMASGSPTVIAPGSCVTLGANNKPLPIVASELNQNNVSWRTGLRWRLDPSTLVYANLTKGFKAGGYSNLPAAKAAQFVPVPQEELLAYEAGAKGSFWNQSFQWSTAAFYYNYKAKQILGRVDTGIPFGALPGMVSIPKSSVRGAELELTWHPLNGWRIVTGASYVDSRVDSDFLTPDPQRVPVNIKGDRFPNTPKWQLVADTEYEFPLMATWQGFIGASGTYRTQSNAAFGNNSDFVIPEYGLLDLRGGVQTADHRWRIQAYGRNVTNKYYWVNVFQGIDTTSRTAGMPVTYGITFSYRH